MLRDCGFTYIVGKTENLLNVFNDYLLDNSTSYLVLCSYYNMIALVTI